MLKFLDGDGMTAEAILSHDWSASGLGSPDDWPPVLKTTVSLVLNSRFPQCIVWGPDLITIPNDAFLPILGDKADALGQPFNEVWSEIWPSLAPIVEKAFVGEATFIEDFPLVINRHGYDEQTYFTFCYSPIRDEWGRIVGMLDTVTETTRQIELHARQQLLSTELGHRLKNMLTVVQAVASQTLRQASDLQSANEALTFRLAAFGRAADILTAADWEDADLTDLIRAVMATHEGIADRFRVSGPPIRFKSEVALGLALAFYELATNATKYGSLSNDGGRVDVDWQVEPASAADDARFRLRWQETGGPPVSPPTRRGFGSLMIERSLRGYMRGDIQVKYEPEGLVFEIDAPLAGAQAKGVTA
jgi:two-component sensor histidine kinase